MDTLPSDAQGPCFLDGFLVFSLPPKGGHGLINHLALVILCYYSKDVRDLVAKTTVLGAEDPRSRCWTTACLVWVIFWFTTNILVLEWCTEKEFMILLFKMLYPQDLITPRKDPPPNATMTGLRISTLESEDTNVQSTIITFLNQDSRDRASSLIREWAAPPQLSQVLSKPCSYIPSAPVELELPSLSQVRVTLD